MVFIPDGSDQLVDDSGIAASKAAKASKLVDLNHDGQINLYDCPHPPGPKANIWFNEMFKPFMQSQVTPEMKAEYGDKVTEAYNGKPCVPGVKGSAEHPQGDFNLMVDKMVKIDGVPKEVDNPEAYAKGTAAKMMNKKYGG